MIKQGLRLCSTEIPSRLGQLGHGGQERELVPRLVEGLVVRNVTAVAAGSSQSTRLVMAILGSSGMVGMRQSLCLAW